jgi:Zn-dependent protease/CBS domain-containing protein
MFRHRLTLFRLFGFGVRLDLSWLLIALLVTWSLAKGLFPRHYPELPGLIHWTMGVLGAIGLFASIIFHEFCHSLVARRYGLQMKGITLFIFGGIAEISEEPASPKTEFLMAGAGPVSSLVLALVFYLLWLLGKSLAWPDPAVGIVGYLTFINVLLALFNLVPAFPLDGGRILRSALWHWKGDLRRATRTATRIGSGFGMGLIFFGILNAIGGNLIGGMWYFLIGLFLRGAATNSYRQMLLQMAFAKKPVASLMDTEPDTISADISLGRLVSEHLPHHKGKIFPVVEEGRLVGCITLAQIKKVPREEWDERRVGELLQSCPENSVIDRETEVLQSLSHMNKAGINRLLVVDGRKLVGTLALSDIVEAFSVWMELENET